MSLAAIKEQINLLTPEFNLESLQLLGSGTDSDAYLANAQWVFRFPKTLAAQKTLLTEIALLPQLVNTLPIKIPEFQYIGESEAGLMYVAYPKLPGTVMEKKDFNALSIDAQEHVLKELAVFLQNLHNFSVAIARDCGVKEEIYKGAYHAEQQRALDVIQHLLTTEEITQIKKLFFAYEDEYANTTKTLLHADLKPEHILMASENIVGIIDWGDVCLGDRDADFTCLYLYYGEEFLLKLLRYFPNLDSEIILKKLPFFILIRWLQDTALFSQTNNQKFVDYCLQNLRAHLQNL